MKQTVLETNAVQLKTESFAYEPGGLVIYATNALGGVTQMLYNSMGKPRFRRGPDGSTNRWTYYLDGRPRREYQGNGAYSETTYDDLNRRVNRIFYTATNSALATNSTVLDRRGNAIQRLDAAGNSFTNLFDGLDRIKIAAGPAIISVPPTNAPSPGGVGGSTTNQQVATSYLESTVAQGSGFFERFFHS